MMLFRKKKSEKIIVNYEYDWQLILLYNLMSAGSLVFFLTFGGFGTVVNLKERLLGYMFLTCTLMYSYKYWTRYSIEDNCVSEVNILGKAVFSIAFDDIVEMGTFVDRPRRAYVDVEYMYLSKVKLKESDVLTANTKMPGVIIIRYNEELYNVVKDKCGF